jgi:type II secretion system protein N
LKPLKFNLQINKKNSLYAAYIAAVTIFFLYVLFPSDTLKKYLAYQLGGGNPNVVVSIKRVSPMLPPGIKLHDVGISHQSVVLFGLDNLKIMPSLLSLFGTKTKVNFKATGYAGRLNGKAEFGDEKKAAEVKIDGKISGVQVQKIPSLQRLSAHKISGLMGGNFAYTNTGPNRSLAGKLSMSDCRVDLAAPVFSQKSLDFRDIDADLLLNNRTLVIKQCTLKGNELDVSISGTIGLNSGAGRNALNLTGTMTPHHTLLAKIEKNLPPNFLKNIKAGKKAISFKIGGTLQDPGFLLN